MSQPSQPVYLRLRDMIAAAIIEGRYGEGDMLPSVRAFAAEQGANPLTVAKAYQLFQSEGLVEVQRGVGMYVAAGATEKLRAMEREDFVTRLPAFRQCMAQQHRQRCHVWSEHNTVRIIGVQEIGCSLVCGLHDRIPFVELLRTLQRWH